MVDFIPVVVNEGELEIRGVDEQQHVWNCEGLPSEKQSLVLSKESTPAKDTGTTVTRHYPSLTQSNQLNWTMCHPLMFSIRC